MRALTMDNVSMNHYEKQLYTVFKTFDVDNEEALNKSAVVELCDALQLEDRGATLVDTLFERRAGRVTFAQFRNGLLSVLGGGGEPAPATSAAPAAPPSDDEDSSGREVAPKFVFGSKKYGRRSRPPRAPAAASPEGPRAASASRLDSDDRRARSSQRMKYRRSTSAMDARDRPSDDLDSTPPGFDHDRRIDSRQALSLCHSFQMDSIDHRLVEQLFKETSNDTMTVGEFFDRLNSSLTTSLEGTQSGEERTLGELVEVVEDESNVATSVIVNLWENGGVPHPRHLLAQLGFTTAVLSPSDLESALNDELRIAAEPVDARILYLVAALELCRFRAGRARKQAEVAAAERDKLRADVAEANRRARLLAQDNDEAHARVEAELAAAVRRGEARLQEAARRAAAAQAAERERATTERARLEAELAQRADAEQRLREQADGHRARVDELEAVAAAASERAAAAEREAARAGAELRAAAAAGARAAADAAEAARAAELARQVAELRRENQQLRDRNDELCAAMEARARRGAGGGWARGAGGGDLSAELAAGEESEAELGGEQAQPEPADGGAHSQLAAAEHRHEQEKLKLSEIIKELEASLEQMKVEYERCEEYWSRKLDEERAAHDAEQRLGDERLADLVARIGEYERQFAPALPPIAERAVLEAQVNDLEAEFAAYRREREAELRARDQRIARLEAAAGAGCACAALASRCAALAAGAGAGAREAASLRARASRAEAASRRLHARLAAADLLVKELYLENCHLATRRAL